MEQFSGFPKRLKARLEGSCWKSHFEQRVPKQSSYTLVVNSGLNRGQLVWMDLWVFEDLHSWDPSTKDLPWFFYILGRRVILFAGWSRTQEWSMGTLVCIDNIGQDSVVTNNCSSVGMSPYPSLYGDPNYRCHQRFPEQREHMTFLVNMKARNGLQKPDQEWTGPDKQATFWETCTKPGQMWKQAHPYPNFSICTQGLKGLRDILWGFWRLQATSELTWTSEPLHTLPHLGTCEVWNRDCHTKNSYARSYGWLEKDPFHDRWLPKNAASPLWSP